MKIRLPRSTHNWVSVIGAVIAIIALFMIVFLFLVSVIMNESSSYLGLIIYILLPTIMIIGLILIPIGMFINIKKRNGRDTEEQEAWPKIDLNNERHRNAFFIFSFGTTILLLISALGSYGAFHYSESVEFCGTTCHKLMIPEYTAYKPSSHARVACVECHVGQGADWYVRSKLSGLYQVYAVLTNNYPKPIPTPIHSLRPARETCERCHWPQKFYAQKLRLERHYLNDEKNTVWDIQLKMKIGAELAAKGLKTGIHWHINPDVRIEYIAADKKNQQLPWVRYTNIRTGKITVYQDKEAKFDTLQIRQSAVRKMDCIDCHNRPSHKYNPPTIFINEALTAGMIPSELPGIKDLAMDICSNEFGSTDSAMQFIRNEIQDKYNSEYPEIVAEKPFLIEQAILGFQEAFKRNIFPEMKVRWDAYPANIGHMEFNGCFRCHDDRHVSNDGKKISKNCNLCHTIMAQGSPDNLEYAVAGKPLKFVHPAEIDEDLNEVLCTDCHTGLNP